MIQLLEYTKLDGVYVITYEKHHDDRGYFYESFKRDDCIKYRINSTFLQDNVSGRVLIDKGSQKGKNRKPAQAFLQTLFDDIAAR